MALVLGTGAASLVGVQRQQIRANLDSSLEQRADAYEATIRESAEEIVLGITTDSDRAIQLVTPAGIVVANTPNLAAVGPVSEPLGSEVGQVIADRQIPELEDDSYRILSRRVQSSSGALDLHVAQNTDDANDTVRSLAIALGLAVPAVTVFLALLTWWLVGRTLRPVDAIRAEVAHISGTDLHRRVPVSNQSDEISRLANTMNSMLDRLDGASKRQRRFVADASHELRTPLTRIRTEVEVDLNQPENADPVATNRIVADEIVGLQQLLDDLLFLARSDEGQRSRHHELLDLDHIVLDRVNDWRARSDDSGDHYSVRRMTFDSSRVRPVAVRGDANQLSRLVENLLSNAMRFAQSVVTVSVDGDGPTARLTVADDGPGVPAEAQDRIFDRFGRADDARSRSDGGSGLGLAIAKDIAVGHGGKIAYDPMSTRGARFIVQLPATLDEQ